jgi:hypothetical protein
MSAKNRKRHAAHATPASHPAVGPAPAAKAAPAEQALPVLGVAKTGDEERSGSIRLRAYDLWEQAGWPDGEADRVRFWCEAEKELTSAPTPS